MSSEKFVLNSDKVYEYSCKIVGQRITEFLIQNTIGQVFIAGTTIEQVMEKQDILLKRNIQTVADFSCEVMEGVIDPFFLDNNGKEFEKVIQVSSQTICDSDKVQMTAIKYSGLFDFETMKRYNKIQKRLLDIYKELDPQNKGSINAQQLHQKFQSQGHASLGESEVKKFCREILEIQFKENESLDSIIIQDYIWNLKAHAYYLQNEKNNDAVVQQIANKDISKSDIIAIENGIRRLRNIFDKGAQHKIRVMVDAEQTFVQHQINSITDQFQQIYNKEYPIIYSTIQSYWKYSGERVKLEIQKAKHLNQRFGIKLVRGAYIVQERALAKENKYEDPIYENQASTGKSYQNNMENIFQNIGEKNEMLVASHNISSVQQMQNLLKKYEEPPKNIFFAQLFGIADHITYTLARDGYPVYKYMPYGNTHILIPYLCRRAQEQYQTMQTLKVSDSLLKSEILDRLSINS